MEASFSLLHELTTVLRLLYYYYLSNASPVELITRPLASLSLSLPTILFFSSQILLLLLLLLLLPPPLEFFTQHRRRREAGSTGFASLSPWCAFPHSAALNRMAMPPDVGYVPSIHPSIHPSIPSAHLYTSEIE